MSSLKSTIQQAIKSGKINIFFLFLVVSFIILLLSKLSKDYTKTVTFDIKVTNLPEEQVIIKDSTHKMDVLLKTYGFKLMTYYLSTPKLTVDLNRVQRVNNQYVWTASSNSTDIKLQFTDNVEVESIKPDTLIFNYDVNFVKKVPIIVVEKVNYAPGYNMIGDYVLEPDTIRLIGPRVIVEAITMIETDTLILNDVKTNINDILKLKLPEQIETIAMSSKRVKVTATIDKFTEGRVEVPITIINLPGNVSVNYFPKKVSVIFNTALSNYKSIQSKDFKVECDYNELNPQASFLTPKIVITPKTVRTARINQTKIEFIISQ